MKRYLLIKLNRKILLNEIKRDYYKIDRFLLVLQIGITHPLHSSTRIPHLISVYEGESKARTRDK